jgi:hypothetical protein
MKLETDEMEILDSVERREWRSARKPKRVLSRYSRSTKTTFKKVAVSTFGFRPRTWKRSRSVRSRKDFPTTR